MLIYAGYFIAALVNLAPVTGVLSANRQAAAYGIELHGIDLTLLMRHRAILFGIVGGLLLAAIWKPELRTLAATVGLVSMVSFAVLVIGTSGANEALTRLAWIDAATAVILAAALVAHLATS